MNWLRTEVTDLRFDTKTGCLKQAREENLDQSADDRRREKLADFILSENELVLSFSHYLSRSN